MWKPWLQLECLIATEKREGELVNGEKARGDHVFLSKGKTDQTIVWAFCEDEKSNWTIMLVPSASLFITFISNYSGLAQQHVFTEMFLKGDMSRLHM